MRLFARTIYYLIFYSNWSLLFIYSRSPNDNDLPRIVRLLSNRYIYIVYLPPNPQLNTHYENNNLLWSSLSLHFDVFLLFYIYYRKLQLNSREVQRENERAWICLLLLLLLENEYNYESIFYLCRRLDVHRVEFFSHFLIRSLLSLQLRSSCSMARKQEGWGRFGGCIVHIYFTYDHIENTWKKVPIKLVLCLIMMWKRKRYRKKRKRRKSASSFSLDRVLLKNTTSMHKNTQTQTLLLLLHHNKAGKDYNKPVLWSFSCFVYFVVLLYL